MRATRTGGACAQFFAVTTGENPTGRPGRDAQPRLRVDGRFLRPAVYNVEKFEAKISARRASKWITESTTFRAKLTSFIDGLRKTLCARGQCCLSHPGPGSGLTAGRAG